MLTRRNLLALSAAAPFAHLPQRLDLPDPRVDALNTGDAQVLGISPDGATLICKVGKDRLCFIDAATRMVRIDTEPLERLLHLDPESISWSADSKQVAFSLQSWRFAVDSNIFVAHAETGEIDDLTKVEAEPEDSRLMGAEGFSIDLYPTWIDEDTILFARHANYPETYWPVNLATASVSTGEISTWAELDSTEVQYISSPVTHLSDDRVICFVDYADRRRAIALIDREGEITEVNTDVVTAPMLLDANDTHCLVADQRAPGQYLIPYDASEETVSVHDLFGLAAGDPLRSYTAFGPEPGNLVTVAHEHRALLVREDDKIRLAAELRGEGQPQYCHWVGNQVLVTGKAHSWIIDLD